MNAAAAPQRVLVVGPPASGKSALAAEFRNLKNPRVVGIDLESTCMHACDAQTLTPLQPTDAKGKHVALFDIPKLETQLKAIAPDVLVIACGELGNSFLMTHLFDTIIFLDVNADTMRRRLSSRPKNTWAQKPNLVDVFVQTIGVRRLFWQHSGAIIVNNDGPISKTVATVLELAGLEV